jgi:hypothetical protein
VRVGLVVVAPALVALLVAVSSSNALPRSQLQPLFDGKAAAQVAQTLSAEYPSRVPGSNAAADAARWYSETMAALGISTTEDVWTENLPDLGRVTLRNVVSVVPGRSPDAIVLVAHRDNAGPGRPAADDATGTAALVELARGFAAQEPAVAPRPQHTLVFVSTDAGAYGGAGAERFATRWPSSGTVVAAVVVDSLSGSGAPRLAIAGDGTTSPPQALVRTASARVEEEVGTAPLLPSSATQLVGLGVPFAALEQGRFLGRHIAAVTLATEQTGSPGAPEPALNADRVGRMGKAVEALVDSLDSSAGPPLQTPDALYFTSRAVRGWAIRLTLILLVVPVSLGVVDLLARTRRRRVPLAPALRALRARLLVWLVGAGLLGLGALVGVFPTGASLPLPAFTELVSDPPVVSIAIFASLFVLFWLVTRRTILPRHRASTDERLGGLLVGLLALCALSIVLAVAKPYALVFVLPSLYTWPWIPAERASWRGGLLLLTGMLGPVLGLVVLAAQIHLGLVETALYLAGLATVGYVSLGSVLAAVCWIAVAAQVAAVSAGRYAPYAGGIEPPPPGMIRSGVAWIARRRPSRA